MPQEWKYAVDLPPGMTHTLQVQSNSPDADFNLYVIDPAGNVVAADQGPEAGAECSLTSREGGNYVLRIELVDGHCGFSMNVSSRTATAAELEASGNSNKTITTTPRPERKPAASLASSELTQDEIDGLVVAHNEWRARYKCPRSNGAKSWPTTLRTGRTNLPRTCRCNTVPPTTMARTCIGAPARTPLRKRSSMRGAARLSSTTRQKTTGGPKPVTSAK